MITGATAFDLHGHDVFSASIADDHGAEALRNGVSRLYRSIGKGKGQANGKGQAKGKGAAESRTGFAIAERNMSESRTGSAAVAKRNTTRRLGGVYENGGSNCKYSYTSCNLCSSSTHHYGCHAALSDWGSGAFTVTLTNSQACKDQNGDGTVNVGTNKKGWGSGRSICWDTRYHGSRGGILCGTNGLCERLPAPRT